LLPLLCGQLYSWLFQWSYISYGKNLMVKILDFAIKLLIIGGIIGFFIGMFLVLELVFIR
jgi:hypothetical protein